MDTILKPCTEEDFDFAFEVKKEALGQYIIEKWGWDEALQKKIHSQRWKEKPWSIINISEKPIGTISIHSIDKNMERLGEFYILKKYQGRGIGTKILRSFLDKCDLDQKWVRLEYLKWNPVGSLYKRNGFKIVGESEIHYFLERKPDAH